MTEHPTAHGLAHLLHHRPEVAGIGVAAQTHDLAVMNA